MISQHPTSCRLSLASLSEFLLGEKTELALTEILAVLFNNLRSDFFIFLGGGGGRGCRFSTAGSSKYSSVKTSGLQE